MGLNEGDQMKCLFCRYHPWRLGRIFTTPIGGIGGRVTVYTDEYRFSADYIDMGDGPCPHETVDAVDG